MRRLLALVLLLFAVPAVAAPPTIGGWTAHAGSPAYISISEPAGGPTGVFTLQTKDGTAKAGTDYTPVTQTITITSTPFSARVPVQTQVNPAQLGQTLHFGARITLNGTVIANAGSSIVEPTVAPPPSFPGAPSIASDFDPALGMKAIPVNTLDMGKDPVGAFRFICGGGPANYDDPLVFPGQPGASHLHQYYGELGVNAFTTYESLRKEPDATARSTCSGDPKLGGLHVLNRSAYWMPAILVGDKWLLQPDDVSIYYKRLPKSDPNCKSVADGGQGECVPIPNGLGMIAGYDMVTNTTPTGHHKFLCVTPGGAVVIGDSENFVQIADCPVGDRIDARLSMPDCWNGKDLNSPNHRDHVAYMVLHNGVYSCPATHPDQMPVFTIAVMYSVTPEVHDALQELKAEAAAGTPWDYAKVLHYSSDEMRPNLVPGETEHADFLEAHDPIEKRMWDTDADGCINGHKNGSGGDLCNGFRILGASQPYYNGVPRWTNPVPLAPIPARPTASAAM